MDIALTEEEQRLVETARAFAADVVAPRAADWERDRVMPREAIRAAVEAGLGSLLVPKEHGGQGASRTTLARVAEELSAVDMAFAFSLVVHNNHLNSIANAGNPEHIERYLPRMLTGEVIGSFLLTEPQGGSDAAAITTSATRDGDGWRLNGRKAWVTNAAEADLLSVYAQTDPDKGWRGIATFQVEAERDGVVREAPYSTLGAHAMGTGGFRFEDCRVEDRAMLLPPGDGFKFAMSGIDLARACVAAMCCGILRTSLDVALGYAAGRRAFGQRIADFQGLQWQLADVATDLHAARLMAYEAMRLIDAGQAAAIEAAHAKKFATRVALTGVAECMQAMGADGYKHDFPLARHLACAKMGQYIDGTTEIQNVVIGRALLKPYID